MAFCRRCWPSAALRCSGRLFGILTTMQLLELANPTQPLLRRLLMRRPAPTPQHHGRHWPKRAAEVIGADSLPCARGGVLPRRCKLERPWAIHRNQADSLANVHDTLDPVASARSIAAQRHRRGQAGGKVRLPPKLREMNPAASRTRTISFFYQQASERTTEKRGRGGSSPILDRARRRAKRPSSCLSDSIEAAARAARDHSREAIEHLVRAHSSANASRKASSTTAISPCAISPASSSRSCNAAHRHLPPTHPLSARGNTRPTPDQPRTGVGTDVAASA